MFLTGILAVHSIARQLTEAARYHQNPFRLENSTAYFGEITEVTKSMIFKILFIFPFWICFSSLQSLTMDVFLHLLREKNK